MRDMVLESSIYDPVLILLNSAVFPTPRFPKNIILLVRAEDTFLLSNVEYVRGLLYSPADVAARLLSIFKTLNGS